MIISEQVMSAPKFIQIRRKGRLPTVVKGAMQILPWKERVEEQSVLSTIAPTQFVVVIDIGVGVEDDVMLTISDCDY